MKQQHNLIRLCRRATKCLETERALILSGAFDQIGPILAEKEILIGKVMICAEKLLDSDQLPVDKSQHLAARTLREVIRAAEENSIVLSGALRGLRTGQVHQIQKQVSLFAYTANGCHGPAAPLPKNNEVLA